MMEKIEKLDINGPAASPSNPSVKFTALLVATIIKIAQGIKNKPKLGVKFLRNGIHNSVFGLQKKYHTLTTSNAAEICNVNFKREEMPLLLCIFLQSSMNPIKPKLNKHKRKIHV